MGIECYQPPPDMAAVQPAIVDYDESVDYKGFLFYFEFVEDTTFELKFDWESEFHGGMRAHYKYVKGSDIESRIGKIAILKCR